VKENTTQLPRVAQREMSHNFDAEALVLGALINFPDQLSEVMEKLKPADFYHHAHKEIFSTMCSYAHEHGGNGPDLLTLFDLLGADDTDAAFAAKHLKDELWSTDLDQDVRLILGASVQRQHYHAAQKLAQISVEISDPDKSREAVERLLYGLTMAHAPTSDFDALEDVLGDCLNDIEQAYANRGKLIGVTTGYSDLDLMTNGFQRSDLVILAARPAVGKTSLGMCISYHAAAAGHAVAVFSLEMGKKQLGNRLLSLKSGIPSNKLRAGWLKEEDWSKVVAASEHLSELALYVDDTAGSAISSIRSKLRRLQARIGRPLDLVVVDYLQLMEDDEDNAAKRENRQQEISKISRGLKAIAREFNVPVLALAQLSRAVESRQVKIPMLSDLRESGSLEQDADIVMFIYRDELYNFESEHKNEANVIIAKHRNGPVGEVVLRFDPSLTRFDNLEGEISDYATIA
jgi:replicative DNA helicase